MRVSAHRVQKLTKTELFSCFPPRRADAHKGDFGKVLLLCGARGFTGAAMLAASAALRCGSGLVYLGVPEGVYPQISSALREAVVFPLPENAAGTFSKQAIPQIQTRLSVCDAVLFGPGCGANADTEAIARFLLAESKIPVILDADGLNVFAHNHEALRTSRAPLVITPHDGEFARLNSDLQPDRAADALRFAQAHSCVVLRKGFHTIITDGRTLYRNQTGNPGMAVGGSGDVLSGIIVSILGRGINPLTAAAAGAMLHGACGDLAAERYGEYAMLPTDMIAELKNLLP